MGRATAKPSVAERTAARWSLGAKRQPECRLFEGLRNLAIIVLLAVLGVLLLRRRGAVAPRATEAAPASAQVPPTPTGEAYVDESGKPTE